MRSSSIRLPYAAPAPVVKRLSREPSKLWLSVRFRPGACFHRGRSRLRAMGVSVTVTRVPHPWRDRIRAYKLVVDGATVGAVRLGETLDVQVTPGRHRVWMRVDWCRSQKLDLDASDGERIR